MKVQFPHGQKTPLLENIGGSTATSLVVREFHFPAFTYPWHQHPEAELTWILRGNGLRYVGDNVEPFTAGDFCLIGPNVPHTWLSERGQSRGVRSVVVQFDPMLILAEPPVASEFLPLRYLLERSSRGLSLPTELSKRCLERVLSADTSLQKLTALLEILEKLTGKTQVRDLSISPWGAAKARCLDIDRLGRVMNFIGRSHEKPPTHCEAAKVAGLTPSAFSRFFRNAVGRTYQDYLMRLRTGIASRKLLETELSVTEIAFSSGFENLSTFHRTFQKYLSMSPRQFRKMHAKLLSPRDVTG